MKKQVLISKQFISPAGKLFCSLLSNDSEIELFTTQQLPNNAQSEVYLTTGHEITVQVFNHIPLSSNVKHGALVSTATMLWKIQKTFDSYEQLHLQCSFLPEKKKMNYRFYEYGDYNCITEITDNEHMLVISQESDDILEDLFKNVGSTFKPTKEQANPTENAIFPTEIPYMQKGSDIYLRFFIAYSTLNRNPNPCVSLAIERWGKELFNYMHQNS